MYRVRPVFQNDHFGEYSNSTNLPASGHCLIKSQELFDLLLETARKESISPKKLAAYLGYRATYMKDKKTAAVFNDLYLGIPNSVV
jgi:hypothetical protein